MNRDVDLLAREVIGLALNIHRSIGPGLLESVYETILADHLELAGHTIERQKPVTFAFENRLYRDVLRLDLLVNGVLVLELKSVEKLAPVHHRQVVTYLRLLRLPLGLLLNFGAATMKEGTHRIVNGYRPTPHSGLSINQEAQ
jgi:GxxExxY protein